MCVSTTECNYNNTTKENDRINKLAALSFLLGSLLFTVDGIGYCVKSFNWHSLLYTLGSLLFAVGSALMLL